MISPQRERQQPRMGRWVDAIGTSRLHDLDDNVPKQLTRRAFDHEGTTPTRTQIMRVHTVPQIRKLLQVLHRNKRWRKLFELFVQSFVHSEQMRFPSATEYAYGFCCADVSGEPDRSFGCWDSKLDFLKCPLVVRE